MRLSDAEAKLKDCAARIDTARLMSKLREYERYGLPGSSFSDGRGGEPPLPHVGYTDRQIELAREGAIHHATQAALHLERLLRIQTIWCEPLDDDTTKQAKLAKPPAGAGPCGNIHCDHTCTGKEPDRLRKANLRAGQDPAKALVARCPACDRHWRRHGNERDPRAVTKPGDATPLGMTRV